MTVFVNPFLSLDLWNSAGFGVSPVLGVLDCIAGLHIYLCFEGDVGFWEFAFGVLGLGNLRITEMVSKRFRLGYVGSAS